MRVYLEYRKLYCPLVTKADRANLTFWYVAGGQEREGGGVRHRFRGIVVLAGGS